jgi:hypothetical protein
MTRTRVECPHEDEVVSAVQTRRWPRRTSPEIVAHVADCQVCSELVAVVSAFEMEQDQAGEPYRPPDATVVWVRAQMRARVEAERLAARPITFAQAVGLATTVGVVGAVFGASATWFQAPVAAAWTSTWASVKALATIQPPALPSALVSLLATHGLLLAGAVVACLVLAPVAVYLTVRED